MVLINNQFEEVKLDKAFYNKILNVLKYKSTTFVLASVNTYFQKGILLDDNLSKTKAELFDYCISKKWSKKWAGSKYSKKVAIHTYITNHYCIEYLRSLNSFFELEDDMDISFYDNDVCLLYTISHEGSCLIHKDLIKNF